MTREDYPCRQGLTAAQRQDFYDWSITHYGQDPDCRYCQYAQCSDPWGHVNREIAWSIHEALKAGVNQWRDMPIPALVGFYGHDYE